MKNKIIQNMTKQNVLDIIKIGCILIVDKYAESYYLNSDIHIGS